MAGAAGVPWIERALKSGVDTVHPNVNEALRAELLRLLATRGDARALEALRDTRSNDPVVRACRLSVLSLETDRQALVEALQHENARVRRTALQRLRHADIDPVFALELQQIARLDPDTEVRALAIEVLSNTQHVALEWLQARLFDRELSVRAVAMRELARLDCSRARAALADRLSAAPSRDGLAALRALARCDANTLSTTLDVLRRTLSVPDTALRAEAASAADSLAWLRVPTWLSNALEHDPVAAVRFAIARALQRTQPAMAQRALRGLARGDNAMVSVQAAAVLAESGDATARSIVSAARTHREANVRRAAFRALGAITQAATLKDATLLAAGLEDADVGVRLAAAGALLRAAL